MSDANDSVASEGSSIEAASSTDEEQRPGTARAWLQCGGLLCSLFAVAAINGRSPGWWGLHFAEIAIIVLFWLGTAVVAWYSLRAVLEWFQPPEWPTDPPKPLPVRSFVFTPVFVALVVIVTATDVPFERSFEADREELERFAQHGAPLELSPAGWLNTCVRIPLEEGVLLMCDWSAPTQWGYLYLPDGRPPTDTFRMPALTRGTSTRPVLRTEVIRLQMVRQLNAEWYVMAWNLGEES